jgi:hypothetical protein
MKIRICTGQTGVSWDLGPGAPKRWWLGEMLRPALAARKEPRRSWNSPDSLSRPWRQVKRSAHNFPGNSQAGEIGEAG